MAITIPPTTAVLALGKTEDLGAKQKNSSKQMVWNLTKETSPSDSGSTQRVSFSNLLQVVALETVPGALPNDYQYNTGVRILSDAVGTQTSHNDGVKSTHFQALKAWGKRNSTDGRRG